MYGQSQHQQLKMIPECEGAVVDSNKKSDWIWEDEDCIMFNRV